jgi:hypothetical protein
MFSASCGKSPFATLFCHNFPKKSEFALFLDNKVVTETSANVVQLATAALQEDSYSVQMGMCAQ